LEEDLPIRNPFKISLFLRKNLGEEAWIGFRLHLDRRCGCSWAPLPLAVLGATAGRLPDRCGVSLAADPAGRGGVAAATSRALTGAAWAASSRRCEPPWPSLLGPPPLGALPSPLRCAAAAAAAGGIGAGAAARSLGAGHPRRARDRRREPAGVLPRAGTTSSVPSIRSNQRDSS